MVELYLKPCPFCGGKAEIVDCVGKYFVRCRKCMVNQDRLYSQKCSAAKAWNKSVKIDGRRIHKKE